MCSVTVHWPREVLLRSVRLYNIELAASLPLHAQCCATEDGIWRTARDRWVQRGAKTFLPFLRAVNSPCESEAQGYGAWSRRVWQTQFSLRCFETVIIIHDKVAAGSALTFLTLRVCYFRIAWGRNLLVLGTCCLLQDVVTFSPKKGFKFQYFFFFLPWGNTRTGDGVWSFGRVLSKTALGVCLREYFPSFSNSSKRIPSGVCRLSD